MDTKELILDIPAGKLAALEWGDPGGKRVLALHGWLDNAASFSNLAEYMNGHHLIALDLVGHGKSSHRPHGTTYHFVDYVADVVDAATVLGWESYTLLGHSLGAGVASMIASVCHKAVSELVLIEGIGPIPARTSDAPKRLAQAILKRRKCHEWRSLPYPDWRSVIEVRKQAGDLSVEAAELLVRRGAEACEDGIRWRSDPRLRLPSPVYIAEEQAKAFLRAIVAPTLLVKARRGLLNRLNFIDSRIKAVQQIEVVELPGGHHLHLDEPQPVAAVILDFLARNSHPMAR